MISGSLSSCRSPSSRGPGRGPFKAKTRVRIPLGTPILFARIGKLVGELVNEFLPPLRLLLSLAREPILRFDTTDGYAASRIRPAVRHTFSSVAHWGRHIIP